MTATATTGCLPFASQFLGGFGHEPQNNSTASRPRERFHESSTTSAYLMRNRHDK